MFNLVHRTFDGVDWKNLQVEEHKIVAVVASASGDGTVKSCFMTIFEQSYAYERCYFSVLRYTDATSLKTSVDQKHVIIQLFLSPAYVMKLTLSLHSLGK